MRTETVPIYTFDELDLHAQQKALDRWRENMDSDDCWAGEWRDSLTEFASVTGITVKDWSVQDSSSHYVNWSYDPYAMRYAPDNALHDMTGQRLRTWLVNNWLPYFWKGKYYHKSHDVFRYVSRRSRITGSYTGCPLTGFCGDCSLIQPILDFVAKPNDRTDLEDIIRDCFHAWGRDWGSDIEYQSSDECIRETIEANEYEFYADGRMV